MQNRVFRVEIVGKIQRREREEGFVDVVRPVRHVRHPLILVLIEHAHKLIEHHSAERLRLAPRQLAQDEVEQNQTERSQKICIEERVRNFNVVELFCSRQPDKWYVEEGQADCVAPLPGVENSVRDVVCRGEIVNFVKRVRVERRHASGDVEHDSPLQQQNCDRGIPQIALHKKAACAERRSENQNRSERHPSRVADREVAQKTSVAQFCAEPVQRPCRRLRIETHLFHFEAVCERVFLVVLHNTLSCCFQIDSRFRNDAVRLL